MSVALKKGQVADPVCILCSAKLERTGVEYLWMHKPSTECKVVLTDCFGVSADDDFELKGGQI